MLNIHSLNNVRDQKEINKYEIYKLVLKKCHHRIKTLSSKGDSECFYVIPEYIWGIPKYDTISCAGYIVNRLKKNGFKVAYTFPNLLFVSWGHVPSEIKKATENKLKINNTNPEINNRLEYRYIDDYKPAKNFLTKIDSVKKIEYN